MQPAFSSSPVIGVGFLAVPVMTTGAAYDFAQVFGWKHSIESREAKVFYAAITAFTAIGLGMNFIRINPMKALVWAGVVQGFSTPPLLLLIMLMTNRKQIMGDNVNGFALNILGWIMVAAIFAASDRRLVGGKLLILRTQPIIRA
jgi:Mn2+/Fe2+ NRAMP family transporter